MRKALYGYENVLVTDQQGIIQFYDLADISVLERLGYRPEEFIGKHVTDFYTDLSASDSTIMQVISNKQAIVDREQKITAKNGSVFHSFNSTYPLLEKDGSVVGAIEFSKHFFEIEHLPFIEEMSTHQLFRKNSTRYIFDDIVTQTSKMHQVLAKAKRIAKNDSTVLLIGETGTGKEMFAHAIHNESKRYMKSFISLDCGALSEQQAELVLFGSVPGAFPGAQNVPGIFERANDGTLFLDEVTSLSPALQAKLLRVVEMNTVRRVGDTVDRRLDVRLISATNRHYDELVTEQAIRKDLFYRLAVTYLLIPPLRERKEDVPLLFSTFIDFYNKHMVQHIDYIDPEIFVRFETYDWPGNVRELRNLVESLFSEVDCGEVLLNDIPLFANPTSPEETSEIGHKVILRDQMDKLEKQLIEQVWVETEGRIGETARRLGLSRQALKYKLNKFGLE